MTRLVSTSADLRLEQAIYGSRSGDRDYRILAASPGVARADRDLLEQHANLGGSALTAAAVEPIYSAFPLDPRSGRHAFARAVVLGRGGRGNDYLVHALILSPALLQTLRGDLFLLADAGLFGDRKPEGEELSALDLDPGRWEVASRRACGADRPAELALENLAPLLAALAEGPLAVQVAEGSLALSLCRALLSILPPDDRVNLSFCSRFCQPRALPYRFSAFVPEDRPLAERYLRGAVRPLAAEGKGPIAEWLAAAKAGFEPLFGLSLLRDPQRAVAQIRLLGAPPEATVRGRAAGPFLDLAIARHPANAPLARVSAKLLGILAHSLEQFAQAALEAGDPAALFAECGKSLTQAPAAELIKELRAGSGLAARTAEIAVALSVADPAPFRRIFDSADRSLADWVEELLAGAPGLALPFLALAFSRWRELDGNASLSGIMALLAVLPADLPIHPALAAIERAAPDTSDDSRAERRAWFRSYLKLLLPWLGPRVPVALAARLAAQEGLLEEMSAGELLPLVPELAASFPQLLDRARLAALPDPALESFVESAARGLRFAPEGGDGWDLARFPERARLAERLATRAAERLTETVGGVADGASPELARGALALVRAAAGRAEVAAAPLRSSLVALLRAHPAGLTAPAARVAARWRRRFGPLPAFDPLELAAIRAQACRDARESAPRGAGWPVLVWLEALAPQPGRLA